MSNNWLRGSFCQRGSDFDFFFFFFFFLIFFFLVEEEREDSNSTIGPSSARQGNAI